MTIHKEVTTEELTKLISTCTSKQFTGQLDIVEIQLLRSWSLHYHQGSLTGCTTSVHPIRSWCRHVYKHCPELPIYDVGQKSSGVMYWDYNAIATLVKQGQVQQELLVAIAAGHIKEIMFDIQQYSHRLRSSSKMQRQLTYGVIAKDSLDQKNSTRVLIPAMQLWQQAMQTWVSWQTAGLTDYSPNLAPVVRKPKELQQQTSVIAYQNIVEIANGNWSLRDLALKLKQNLLPLTQSIKPYVNQGLIELIEIGDFKETFRPVINSYQERSPVSQPLEPNQPKSRQQSPLIAYIDDSKNDSMKMSHILSLAGYRFLNVQDPIKALLVLLEQKPDLIFLDLVMPIANGYEICAQIRRISAFKETPIIILTNNDGIVDRVRAKMVGASAFLAKPIEQEKVLRIIRRHLAVSSSVQSHREDRGWSKNQHLPKVES